LRKNFGKWWDGYSLILTTAVVIESYPRPGGSRAAAQLKKWGDRYVFQAEIKGSQVLADPGRFTVVKIGRASCRERV
jgi:hypothetical protein